MGLIREPKNIDFTVLDKPWTEEERKELSAYIQKQKEKKKGDKPTTSSEEKKS